MLGMKRFFASVPGSNGIAEIGLLRIIKGPLSVYNAKIAQSLLKPDQEQFRAVARLQKFCESIIDYQPPFIASGKTLSRTSFLSQLYDKNTENNADTKLIPTYNPNTDSFIAPRGVWIQGLPGTGKTMLMDMFYSTLPVQKKTRVHFSQFTILAYSRLFEWQKSKQHSDSATLGVAKQFMDEAWLYCVDEFQATDIATASILKELLKNMFSLGAVLITTSNRMPDEIYKGGFQRHLYQPLIDTLTDRCQVLQIRTAVDYRNEALVQSTPVQKTWFLLTDQSQVNEFIKRAALLFYGKECKEQKLDIYSRTITVPLAADGIALYTFDELCGSLDTLGQADFLRICQEYHTIILQNVPIMDLTLKNEARRFISFIDAAYEFKVKLIVSAQAIAENLFVTKDSTTADIDIMHREMVGEMISESGSQLNAKITKLALFTAEDEKFAFDRAVSRLKEMSTDEWFKKTHDPQPLSKYLPSATAAKSPAQEPNTSSAEPAEIQDYYKTYRRFNKEFKAANDGSFKNFDPKKPPESDKQATENWLKEREKWNPRFKDEHFWGIAEWGPKAGIWGRGIKAFLLKRFNKKS